ncbi:MAG TPA: DUF167 domain-containing protein [Fimbriimonadaceae bacterium]|nr:DUF167 domain-containing protein [Fimbriimonadaceae bacterium]HRJ97246.1 DUF167 domain-containing protein [Fimbriimonadaceae bacterium]
MSGSLPIRVTPRASREHIERGDGGEWKVFVTAPPVGGQANRAVCELIARRLGVSKSAVSIRTGHTSRTKVLAIEGIGEDEIERRLTEDASSP